MLCCEASDIIICMGVHLLRTGLIQESMHPHQSGSLKWSTRAVPGPELGLGASLRRLPRSSQHLKEAFLCSAKITQNAPALVRTWQKSARLM